ncbi:ABC transporter permease subunit [Sphaerisporangium sp. TRM90804]|uniref:ABC transporter permease subunit n=1 Tax=Sphaerisporangium sp. TRM90804 TaxID=3031113 RepID=UPI002449BF80|nr:ABC transporter permease subunit [Sphaerisporangium sp. TRM90804]MDH2429699.1 ABC transporter permease subunit [Sphaerisporangium sp. TRM90804]
MPTLVLKTLREYRRSLIGWTVGICAFAGMYTSFFPQIRANADLYSQAALSKYPDSVRTLLGGLENITSGAGFMQSIIYQLFVPLLFTMCAVALGAKAIAEPEESKTLELTLTLPLDRKRLVLERFAALVVGLLGVAVVSLLVVALVGASVDIGVPFGRILAAHSMVFLLVLFFGTLSLTAGAATGRKAAALGVAGVYAVAGYVVNALAPNVEVMSWLNRLSPFYYYSEGRPLITGFPIGDALVLLAATAVLVMTAVLSFDRRDVGV